MKLLVLDNYDSFTYNLVHIVRELGYGDQMDVIRNDKISLDEVAKYDKILLSPGPGIPSEAGIMMDLIKKYGPEKSIMGVCLGHQGIGEAYGGKLINMAEVLHGISRETVLNHSNDMIFAGLPERFQAGRYHSWVVSNLDIPSELEITALGEDGHIMALKHRTYDVRGVQFHPESVLTPGGKLIIENWLKA